MVATPALVPNWIGGRELEAADGGSFVKLNPHDGREICRVARSRTPDVRSAVEAAASAFAVWSGETAVRRGEILYAVADAMTRRRQDLADVVALETGKSPASARGETDGAIALGRFMAGEGQRMYGRTTTSGTPSRYAALVRQPIGVAGLIIAANTPIANVAWKVFPALICGNAAVLKAAEDTPLTAWLFAAIAHEAGVPPGTLNVVQGLGAEAGEPLVGHPDVGVLSFTGSTNVGRRIAQVAGARLARVSLELGGKNPFVVADDADLDAALRWAVLSAFSNAGQRCAAGSRIIVFDAVYDRFRDALVRRARSLRVGPRDGDDYGPVINLRQLENMLGCLDAARDGGATLLTGGQRLTDDDHRHGFYLAPTLLEADPDAAISSTELFGPVATLYRVPDFEAALALANRSPYGLTACIHTASVHRATEFAHRVQAGVAVVNGGTFGSEPHMPFGGVKASGNGSREPGTEALDVYSSLKNILVQTDPTRL
ncbi:MAG TPA: aldehyde dehydrogenase family protein [Gemmatimonadales bacterium]|nr:aldehyde dehydrogenase family protein [Gemmatimonadales bacterium]